MKKQLSFFGFIEKAEKVMKDKELAKTPLVQSMMAQIYVEAEALCWVVVLNALFGSKNENT